MEYITSSVSKEQWKKIKAKEAAAKGKDLGKVGITSFKSRSFADWQKAGGINLFPVDPKSVKSEKDLPYMQQKGGSADGEDLEEKKKKGMFSFGGKKKKVEEAVAPTQKKKNPWTF